jgi:hypothetical protein
MLRLRVEKKLVARAQSFGLTHHPDFIMYDMNEQEYQLFWKSIVNHPRTQLYTNGAVITKVNWFRSAFERFKGWFGFTDHCQANKVEMTLAKIAYYGYVKGFCCAELEHYNPPLISSQFHNEVRQARHNQRSAGLHQLLKNYYIVNAESFPQSALPINDSYQFGSVLIHMQLYRFIPSIDVQNPQVINRAIVNIPAEQLEWYRGSSFAKAYAEHLLHHNHYLLALEWDETLAEKYKNRFINFYLSQRNHIPLALQIASELIIQLAASPSAEDQDEALYYLKYYFSPQEQLQYLNTEAAIELRKKLARSYAEDALQEKNKYALTKLFLGNKTISFFTHAVSLDSEVSVQDAQLKKEWIQHLFNEAIKHKRLTEARDLFEHNTDLQFDKNNLSTLKSFYLEQIEIKQKLLQGKLAQGDQKDAESLALELRAIARHISIISPQDHPGLACDIIYASTLLAIDQLSNPNPKNANLTKLNHALDLVSEYSLMNPSAGLLQTINNLLLRKIDCLTEQVKGPTGLATSWKERADWARDHQTELTQLIGQIEQYIQLNKKGKTPETKLNVAKMHYILADIYYFFFDNKMTATKHFSEATTMMPTNPYYEYRYLEITNNKRRHEVWETITEMTHTNEADYLGWLEERWDAGEKTIGRGFEIHGVSVEKKGLFSFLI